jgi:flagellar biosynthesis protein FlhF
MKIRRYTCKDMQEAMLKVKMDLGSEAVIMHSRKVRRKGLAGFFAKPMVEVVAAIDDDYVRPRPAVKEQKTVTPEYRPAVSRAYEYKPADIQGNEESNKITYLENKVNSMENMVKEIYKAVQGRDDPISSQKQDKEEISLQVPKSEVMNNTANSAQDKYPGMTATILKAPLREEASQVKDAVQFEASSLNTPFTESISSLSEVL